MKKILFTEISLSKSLAIVGSSGNLLNHENGNKIDGFQNIVRFNRAEVDGYENFVGSKTTLRCVNYPVFICSESGKELWPNHDPFFVKKMTKGNILFLAPSSYRNKKYENMKKKLDSSVNVFNVEYEEAEKKMKSEFNIKESKPFSVGMFFILLSVLSDITPNLFGFDITVEIDRSHYWSKRPKPSGVHNFNSEVKLLQKLINEKKVIYHA